MTWMEETFVMNHFPKIRENSGGHKVCVDSVCALHAFITNEHAWLNGDFKLAAGMSVIDNPSIFFVHYSVMVLPQLSMGKKWGIPVLPRANIDQ